LLIPELYVERGQTYTFLVEGGNDETQPARLKNLNSPINILKNPNIIFLCK